MQRNGFIPTAVVLAIGLLTFGLGNLFFVYYFSDVAGKDKKGNDLIPMREFILNVMTFGVYGIFWTYKISSVIDKAEGRSVSALTVLATLISAFPLRAVSMTLISARLTGDVA